MAAPPRPKSLGRDTIPEAPVWWDKVVSALNPFLTDVAAALDRGLSKENLLRGENTNVRFTTKATVADTWPVLVKPSLPMRPTHLQVTDMVKLDGSAPANAWSFTWKLSQSGMIELTGQGLEASTAYRISIVYE